MKNVVDLSMKMNLFVIQKNKYSGYLIHENPTRDFFIAHHLLVDNKPPK